MKDVFDFQQFPKSNDYTRATITHHQEELLYYDGPLLWAGKNAAGERVLGVSIVWDSVRKIEWDLQGVCSEADYWAYRNKEFDLPELYRRSDCYLIGFFNGDQPPHLHTLKYEEMPEDYGPQDGAFFPGDTPDEQLDANWKPQYT